MCLCVHLLSKGPCYSISTHVLKAQISRVLFQLSSSYRNSTLAETTVRASEHGQLQHLLGEMCLLSLKMSEAFTNRVNGLLLLLGAH